jgi:hypothetical protein
MNSGVLKQHIMLRRVATGTNAYAQRHCRYCGASI